jgi:DNA topoisomerase-2
MTSEIDKKYKKHELRSHIYNRPSMYIGTIDPFTIDTYIIDDDDKITKTNITYIPGLFKIFDEAIVNAIDHSVRTKNDENPSNVLKNIKININKETGVIEIFNDGMGIEIIKHTEYDVWIPEMIFGELLTSSNYNDDEVRIVGGVNGLGIKLTNIFSKEFIIETIDSTRKKLYKQVFSENLTVKEAPEIKSCARKSYTKITFKPDYEKFGLSNMTDDIYKLFKRRVYDVSACTDASVNVYFNDKKINVKDFEKYCDLFLDTKTIQPRCYEKVNDRWEVSVAVSKTGNYEQISFVNGINTIRGGRHVEYITNAITKKLTDMTLAKKKKTIKPQHIKENLFIFVKSTIENPTFDSQTKETLTTLMTKFGSKCELSEKFYEKLYKSGIIELALSATEVVDQKKLVKTDGKKVNKIIVPKLDDANLAGTKDSQNCTLILTEGDSAKTMAISGLSVVGRDNYGVYPLKGKIINVKDITLQKISDNAEIANLKKILGLEQNKDYSKGIDALRYGKIMIMTDQDHDGSHIKGLLFNVFQTLWNSLYKYDGFLTSMLTPIIKAINNSSKEVISFYNMSDYERWLESDEAKKSSWKIKYYKGLGTSTDTEAKEYFKDMKQVKYVCTEESDQSIDLAFNKKRADDRKKWLSTYDKYDVLDYTQTSISYETFINKDLIHFSNRNLERAIPHICDGLKESTRKILFTCLKRNLSNNEIKVAQLAGSVSENTAYHHGENSLQEAIIGMAQIFVGTNNINLLQPNGQFGTRISGGQDSSSPRYIHTLLSKLTKLIFRDEDNAVLNYLDEDGLLIEPEYYIPIIPMVLVNGGIGIGTGYSTNIPQFNPNEIIDIYMNIMNKINSNIGKILNTDDIEKSLAMIEEIEIEELTPYYLGFKGEIIKNDKGNYISNGIYKWNDNSTIEISELPVGSWTENYKEYLEQLLINNNKYLKSFENHYTAKNVKFILKMNDGVKKDELDVKNEFNLTSPKNLSLNNMHLFSVKGAIKKYNTTTEIIKEWTQTRLHKYYERKEKQLIILNEEYDIISAKIRFITDIIAGNIIIMNIKMKEIEEQMEKAEYYKHNDSYDYLLKMPISQLTLEKKENLEKEVAKLKNKIDELKEMSIIKIWQNELEELLAEWNNHKAFIEEDYLNDLNGEVAQTKKPTAKRGVQKKK